MLQINKEKLQDLGATITAKEIKQQPELWEKTFSIYQERRNDIQEYIQKIEQNHEKIRVIFTGAGTSAYVGDTVLPFVKEKMDEKKWEMLSVPTTSMVSNPHQYLKKDVPTLLVSFARSGNSPESVATVELTQQIVDDFYQLTITCAADGKLAQASKGDKKNLLILMPEESNDQGFAMTGSYTCMTLTTLLVFGGLTQEQEKEYVKEIIRLGRNVLERHEEIRSFLEEDYKRIIYLGSGSLEGLAREAQLKVLELTAGKIVTAFDSSLGFRHGPKSFVDETALAFLFVSNDSYTRKYDVDMLKELKADNIANKVIAIQVDRENNFEGNSFTLSGSEIEVPDAFLALPYVIFAQIVSLVSAIKLGNKPDDPSPSGTVNRVVKGVTIYEYK